jgi:hypothetical protein
VSQHSDKCDRIWLKAQGITKLANIYNKLCKNVKKTFRLCEKAFELEENNCRKFLIGFNRLS